MVSSPSEMVSGATVDASLVDRVILPEREQVSRGQELLSMLREQPLGSDSCDSASTSEDADDEYVKVIVKHGFIEIVDPQCRRPMKRSMSDSVLLHGAAESEQPWVQISSDKFASNHDLSDASTTISNDGEDLYATVSADERAVRKDTCWSDDEGTMDVPPYMQPYMPYGYGECWWMPVSFDPSAGYCSAMPDGSAMPGAYWSDMDIECKDADQDAEGDEWRTTVMLRNMPNNYTRDMLLELVDSMGFSGRYDFAYLPVDFKSQAGLGYAFINFVSSKIAQSCFDIFEGFSDWKVPSEKVCTVTWGAPYQGLEAHVERYQNSPVMHHSIPDDWKPVLFENGIRVTFPAPTKPIKTPKVRQQPTSN